MASVCLVLEDGDTDEEGQDRDQGQDRCHDPGSLYARPEVQPGASGRGDDVEQEVERGEKHIVPSQAVETADAELNVPDEQKPCRTNAQVQTPRLLCRPWPVHGDC